MAEKINVGKFINNLDSEDLSSEKLQGVVGNVYAKAIKDHKTTAKKAEDNLKDKDKETVEFTKSNHDRLKAHKNKPEKDLNKDDAPVEDKVVKDINESVEDEIAEKQKQMHKIAKRLDDMTAKNPDAEHTLKFRRLEADMESLAFEIEELKSKSVEESKKQRSPFSKVNESHDCKRNYKNVRFASQEIEKKGYSHAEANDIALKLFDNIEGDTQRSLEWHLEKILPKEEFDKEYPRNEALVEGADEGNLVVKGVTVTGVKDDNVTSVVVPEGIRYIGKGAFYRCTKLKEIKLPETLEGIESDAFAYCTSLEQLEIPKKVQYINTGAFAQCPKLKVLKLPAKFTKGDLGSRGIGFNTDPKIVAESKKTVSNKKLTEAKTFQPMTLREYGKKFLDGYLDTDVYDTEIDMGVAFVFDCDEEPTDNYEKFLSILADNVMVKDAFNDGDLTCDFSGFYKPYNDKINDWYKKNGGHQEFEGEEGYYDLVLATEGLVSGSYSEEDYKELCDIFTSKKNLVGESLIKESAEKIQPGNIYSVLVKELPAEDIDHHYSDLYVRKTPKSTEIVNRLTTKSLLSTFKDNIDGDIWYELPFCYVPYFGESKELNEKNGFLKNYKGCKIIETPSSFVATNEYGLTIGESKTVSGAEGIIDDYVNKKESKKVESKNLKEGAKPSELWYNKKEVLNNIWGLVCEGDDRLEDIRYIFESGLLKPNEFRYDGWGAKHSLIMGALRNGNYKAAELLKSLGEKILKSEVEEYKDLMARKVYSDETTRDALDEAKSSKKLIYTIGDRFVAHQLDGVTSPFNREFDAAKKYRDVSNDPNFKHGSIGCKGKSYKTGVNQWVKTVEPTEFMVWTKKENPSWKDDVLDVYYRKETVNESKTPYGGTTIEDYVNVNFSGSKEDKNKLIAKMREKVDGSNYFNGLNMSVKDWKKAGEEFGLTMKSYPVNESKELTEGKKIDLYVNGEYVCSSTRYKKVKDFVDAVKKDGKVTYAGLDNNGKLSNNVTKTIKDTDKVVGRIVNESKKLKEDWTVFEFTSGSNPYIAKTDKEVKRLLKKYKGRVEWDTYNGNYIVDDKERHGWDKPMYDPDPLPFDMKGYGEALSEEAKGKKVYVVVEIPKDSDVPKLIGVYSNKSDAEKDAYSEGRRWCNVIETTLKESLKEDLSKIQEEQTMKLVRLLGKGLITKEEFEQKLYGIIDEGSKLVRAPMFKNIKIKDFYTDNYPEDDLGEEINDTVTVDDVVDTLNNGGDLYKLIGVTDSLVRERLFEFIADICNTKYDRVYKKWLKEGLVETGRKFLIESQTQEIEQIMNRLKKEFGPEIEAKMDEFVNLPENSKKVWKSGYKIIPDEEIEKDYEITYFQTPEHEPMYARKSDGSYARYGQVLDYSDIFYTEEGWNKFEKWLNDQGIFDTSTHFAISKFDNWPDGYWSTDTERFSTVDGAKKVADRKFKSADVVKIEDDRTHFGTANGATVRFKGKWMTEDDFFKLRNSKKA